MDKKKSDEPKYELDHEERIIESASGSVEAVIETLATKIEKATLNQDFYIDLDVGWEHWEVCKSENYFERLFLDKKLYEKITDSQVESNFKQIDKFLDQMLSFERSGTLNADLYPGMSPYQLKINIREAYDTLKTEEGRKRYYIQLEQTRLNKATQKLLPIIINACEDKLLERAEERLLIALGRDFGLNDEETRTIINEYIRQHPECKRIQTVSGVISGDQMLYGFILDSIDENGKKLIQKDDEKFLKNALNQGMDEQQYESIVKKALRERYGSERIKTIETDKENFRRFYYDLLKNYGLDENNQLPPEAKLKLKERDTSEDNFFPLSSNTRDELIVITTEQYNRDLVKESEAFTKDALIKLRQFEGHDKVENELLRDKKYELLLPRHRKKLIETVRKIIINEQAEKYQNTIQEFIKYEHWVISEEEKNILFSDPNKIDFCKDLRVDWLSIELRKEIWQELDKWAEQEHKSEVHKFKDKIFRIIDKNELKYGLSVKAQTDLEKDTSFHLSLEERRKIIINIEVPFRQNAEKEFVEKVKKSIVFNTLIPEVEQKLLQEGENTYFLIEEKNNISIRTKTAKEIINSLRTSFNDVIKSQVHNIADKKRMKPSLIKEFNLQYTAYFSKEELEDFIKQYNPSSEQEKISIENAFKTYAAEFELYIVNEESLKDFKKVLLNSVVKFSQNYRYRLKKWFNKEFKSNMVKIGAAYGLSESKVLKELNFIQQEYVDWTRPRWGQFFKWFLLISIVIIIFYRDFHSYWPNMVLGTYFAFIFAFYLSTRKLRRSYLKLIGINFLLFLIALMATIQIGKPLIPDDLRQITKGRSHTSNPSPIFYGTVNTSRGINVRKSPSTQARIVASLPKFANFRLIGKYHNWFKIKAYLRNKEITGYVFANLVKVKKISTVNAKLFNAQGIINLTINGQKALENYWVNAKDTLSIELLPYMKIGKNYFKVNFKNEDLFLSPTLTISVNNSLRAYKRIGNKVNNEVQFIFHLP